MSAVSEEVRDAADAPARLRKRSKVLVEVGGREYTLAPLSGRRAFAAFRLVSAITSKVGDVQLKMARYERDYEMANALRLTPSTAWMPGLPPAIQAMTREDWEARGGVLEIPQPPSQLQIIAAILPDVLAAAEEEVLQLLALAIVDNDSFGNAVINGGQGALLNTKRDELLRDCDLDDLVELIDAVVGHLGDQLKGVAAKSGNVRRLLRLEPDKETPETARDPEPSAAATDGTKPDSSTGSEEPTAGDPDRSSTESPTSSS